MGNCCTGETGSDIPGSMQRSEHKIRLRLQIYSRSLHKSKSGVGLQAAVGVNSENINAPRAPIVKVLGMNPVGTRVKEVEVGLSPFDYSCYYNQEFSGLPILGPYKYPSIGSPTYIGQYKDGMRHGAGKQVWADGSLYEGYWYNDKSSFKGRLFHVEGDVYEGDWRDDKAHGFGTYRHYDGTVYIGEWKNDKQSGRGTEKWCDGSYYEGDYVDSLKHGRGTFKWADGSSFEGEFKNNDIEGDGSYRWQDGRIYKGQWKYNKMHGRGEFTWPNGTKYVGFYNLDKKEGYGEFYWPDGRVYKGQWLLGKQHGKGDYTDEQGLSINSHLCETQGKTRSGTWYQGKRVSWADEDGEAIGQISPRAM